MLKNWTSKIGVSLPVIMFLTACGGGSGNSSLTPPVAVNQPPTASAISKLSIATEGQPFELDASSSSDQDGDSLTYAWRQTSGTTVEIPSPSQSSLTLTAPLLDVDESLSFEVTVSDGEFNRSSTVSLSIEDLKTNEVQSQTTQYGTGGPLNPSETVADPSQYEGNKPLVSIMGLTPTPGGGYTVHWVPRSAGIDTPISSQVFSAEGERVGEQIDGVFNGGTFNQDENIGINFRGGGVFDAVMSGDHLYYTNFIFEFSQGFSIGLSSHRGLVQGEVEGFGDTYVAQRDDYQNILGFFNAPIGQDKLLSVITTLDEDDSDLIQTAYIIDPNGQAISHVLSKAPSDINPTYIHGLTTSVYAGTSYVAAWSQSDAENGFDIKMQRANQDGNLLGNVETINTVKDGDQIHPVSATMADGNIFIAWLDNTAGSEVATLKGSIISPNGTFLTDEAIISPSLPRFDAEDRTNEFYIAVTALTTNDVMISWRDETSGASRLKAVVVDSEFSLVSNEFLIAEGLAAEQIETVKSTVLPDNKVIMTWQNKSPTNPSKETSHSVGFYPVGKE